MYRTPCNKEFQVFVQFPVRQPETIRDPAFAGNILCADNKSQTFCHDMGKNMISFVSPVSQYDRFSRGFYIFQHLDQGTGFIFFRSVYLYIFCCRDHTAHGDGADWNLFFHCRKAYSFPNHPDHKKCSGRIRHRPEAEIHHRFAR